LATVADSVAGGCTTRSYGFNAATDRSSITTYAPAASGTCQTSVAATSATWTYDSADRVNTTGYTYDALGRTTTVPAADTQVPTAGDVTATYAVNDLVTTITQNGSTSTYTLDADNQRIRSWAVNDGTTTTTKTNHYDTTGDSPAWISEGDGSWSRYTGGLPQGVGKVVWAGGDTPVVRR
jgi:hypothetical protein